MTDQGIPTMRVARSRLPLIILIGPFLLFFVAFFVAPIVYAVVQSLFSVRTSGLGLGPPQTIFVGLDNYVRALSNELFVSSLGRIVLFAIVQVPLMVVASTALALLLESGKAKWPRFFRVVFFMPYGVPGVIAALLWGFLYIPSTSPVLQGLSALGVTLVPLSSDSIILAIANIGLWSFAGYNMLVLIAALQAVPAELYEAAEIDGAGQWAVTWNIKLPLLRPSIVLTTVFTIIGTLQLFVEPLVLRPLTTAINNDFTPNLAAYNQAFGQSNPNLAAAMAVIVALIAFVFSFAFLRAVNRKGQSAW
jgi:multiple sugar transport system permease protein